MTDTASAAPSDAEIDAQWRESVEKHDTTAAFVRDFARAVLAKWGTLRAEKIVIPTDTMEQEFQKHYRRGYEAGKKAATPQPTQAANSVLEDAARYRFLRGHCRSTSEHWGGRWSIVVEGPAPKSHDSEDDFDEAVDAARKQGANHD